MCEEQGNEVAATRRGGNSGTGERVGRGWDSPALAQITRGSALRPLTVRPAGRSVVVVPGRAPRCEHSVTKRNQVKKCNAIFSSFELPCRTCFHGTGTAGPLRGSTLARETFPLQRSGSPGHLGMRLRSGRWGRPPNFGGAVQDRFSARSVEVVRGSARCERRRPGRRPAQGAGTVRTGWTGASSPIACQRHSALCSHSDRLERVWGTLLPTHSARPSGNLAQPGLGQHQKLTPNRLCARKNADFGPKRSLPGAWPGRSGPCLQ